MPLLKWYWVHMAAQVAFAYREFCLIHQLNGWYPQVMAAHIATWVTILLVSREVWNFSKERRGSERRIVALDCLLDMLLLPVNIVFFCSLCVRVLKLQKNSTMESMVSLVIDCPEIYEAFALWSVLELFVKVAHAQLKKDEQACRPFRATRRAQRDRENREDVGRNDQVDRSQGDEDKVSSFESFKAISFYGVQAWVIIQTIAVIFKLILQGVVGVYAPTLCYWGFQTCKTCNEWYEEHVESPMFAVTFLLCSFAIMFVFYFELGWKRYLVNIQPMWKFLGVKGIVSVTYAQWIIIRCMASSFNWDSTDAYLWHALLYTFWMPILAMVHSFLAYPYRTSWSRQDEKLADWLEAWLDTIRYMDGMEQAAGVDSDDRPEDDHHISGRANQVAREPNLVGGHMEDNPASRLTPATSLFFPFLYCAVCCYASIWFVLKVIPVELSMAGSQMPIHNISCQNEGDIAHYLQGSSAHFRLLNDTAVKWNMLNLCESRTVNCQLGHYQVSKKQPMIKCTPEGRYETFGKCSSISCDEPPKIPHATAQIDDVAKQNFTYGVTIHYDCEKPGWHGFMKATCNITKKWDVQGSCEAITCKDTPPIIPKHAKLPQNHSPPEGGIRAGMIVRFQCDDNYTGLPEAHCGDDGEYITQGRCRRECCCPPTLPHASPDYDNNDVAKHGWVEGMRAKYRCNHGFEGFVTAVCGGDGKFHESGTCNPVQCGRPPSLAPTADLQIDDITKQNWTDGVTVHYKCRIPRFHGKIQTTCNETGKWVFQGKCDEVKCGAPPQDIIPHAKPLVDPNKAGEMNVIAGMQVPYKCEQFYAGTPTANCNITGMYIPRGRCRRECSGQPPPIPRATANVTNDAASAGWMEGMRVPYICDPEYEGFVTALCAEDGSFQTEGSCILVPDLQREQLYRSLHGLWATVGIENGLAVVAIALWFWRRYRTPGARETGASLLSPQTDRRSPSLLTEMSEGQPSRQVVRHSGPAESGV